MFEKNDRKSNVIFEELKTILVEVETIVNNRPISYVYDDNEGISYALTPSHLIYGRRIATIPSDAHYEIVSTAKSLTKRSKHHMKLLDRFTKSWKRNYLLNLRERSLKTDGSFKETGIRIGDIVLLKGENSRRTFWKLAKVENVIKGPDGIARKIKVLTNDGRTVVLRRSVKNLIPMKFKRDDDEWNRMMLPSSKMKIYRNTLTKSQIEQKGQDGTPKLLVVEYDSFLFLIDFSDQPGVVCRDLLP